MTRLRSLQRQSRYVRPLRELRRTDASRVGHKAANLGELAAAGFAVPDGIVVTTEAFVDAMRCLGRTPTHEATLATDVPDAVARAIRGALGDLASRPVAVRSSSVSEDLDDTSFAGLYDTVLGAEGADAILDAVRRCWASAHSARAQAYREQHDLDNGAMAVVIQRLVPAEAAGVCFTANPVTGARTEAVVNAVKGLGDRLVSGEVTPDAWVVHGEDVRCTAEVEGALDDVRVRQTVVLARRIEQHFGVPQDIEWAYADGELHVLQARPITALPEPPVEPIPMPIEIPEGYWERDVTHAPRPGSPMHGSFFLPILEGLHGPLFEEMGFLVEDIAFRPIGGMLYIRMVPLGGKDRKPPPAWMMPLLRRIVPSLRRRVARSVRNVRSRWFEAQLERWHNEWRPALRQRLAAVRRIDRASLSTDELIAHIADIRKLTRDALDAHTRLNFAMIVVLGRFSFLAEELLGWDTDASMGLFAGLSKMSTEPARQLVPLRDMAARSQTIRAALDLPDAGTQAWTERLRAHEPEFADAWEQYVHDYGCRAIRLDLSDPNLEEMPDVLLSALRGMLKRGYDPDAVAADAARAYEARLSEARAALGDRSPAARDEFERRLTAARRAYSGREDSEFFTISYPWGLARRALLEAGQRLVDAGVLDRVQDVFFIEYDEVVAALRKGGDLRARILERRGHFVWADQRAGSEPTSYGTPPSPPTDLSWLPPEAADLMRCLIWFGTHIIAAEARGDGLTGIPAGGGTYEGPARIIRDESQFSKLKPGDVLVCPITSPVWSVLFPNVGALVTDTGGLLSHSAIIAREYRIPAVLGTGSATRTLEDGQRVRVDGTAGRIEVLS